MSVKLNFKPVTPKDAPLIWSYLQQEKGRTTDFSFGGFFMWIEYFKYEYCIVNDTLFIKGVLEDDRDVPAFSLPIGKMQPAEWLAAIREYCAERGLTPEFSAVPETSLDIFQQLSPTEIKPLEAWGDYLYDAAPMATYAGKKMSKKRGHLHRFLADNEGRWTFERLSHDNLADAIAFMDIADAEGDESDSARAERELTRRLLTLADIYHPWLEGGILRVDGRVVGFTIGDVKDDTLFVHIEKGDRNVAGCYETLAHMFTASMLQTHPQLRYINREDDAGDPGLRRSKESFHPITILKKFNIVF